MNSLLAQKPIDGTNSKRILLFIAVQSPGERVKFSHLPRLPLSCVSTAHIRFYSACRMFRPGRYRSPYFRPPTIRHEFPRERCRTRDPPPRPVLFTVSGRLVETRLVVYAFRRERRVPIDPHLHYPQRPATTPRTDYREIFASGLLLSPASCVLPEQEAIPPSASNSRPNSTVHSARSRIYFRIQCRYRVECKFVSRDERLVRTAIRHLRTLRGYFTLLARAREPTRVAPRRDCTE